MYIVIAGSGKSSRNNTEALLEDYLQANPDCTLVVPACDNGFSLTQIHAAQFFMFKEKSVLAVLREDGEEVIESSEVVEVDTEEEVLPKALSYLKKQKDGLFIAWNDDDPLSANTLLAATTSGIKAYDLTNGLMEITPSKDIASFDEPNIPEEEKIIASAEEADDELDEDGVQIFNIGQIEQIAQIFAKAFAKELKGLLR